MNKILIIEKEISLSLNIKKALQNLGYNNVSYENNSFDALKNIKKQIPDLILLDISINDTSKIDFIKMLAKNYQYIPFIYLIKDYNEHIIKKAVQTNPIGFFKKNYDFKDLRIYIELALHKKQKIVNKKYTCLKNAYSFDMKNNILYHHNSPVKLSKNEKKLIQNLIYAKGKIVSFSDLEYEIWDTPISSGAFRTLLYRLRAKLKYNFITTIPSVGCKIDLNN